MSVERVTTACQKCGYRQKVAVDTFEFTCNNCHAEQRRSVPKTQSLTLGEPQQATNPTKSSKLASSPSNAKFSAPPDDFQTYHDGFHADAQLPVKSGGKKLVGSLVVVGLLLSTIGGVVWLERDKLFPAHIVAKIAEPTYDEAPWAKADLVLTAPGTEALGLVKREANENSGFLIHSVEKKQPEKAIQATEKAKVRLLRVDREFIERITKKGKLGEKLSDEAEAELARLLFDKEPWNQCDFALIHAPTLNQPRSMVGLKRLEADRTAPIKKGEPATPKFKLVGRVSSPNDSSLAIETGIATGLTMLKGESALAAKIHSQTKLGEELAPELAAQVDALFRPREMTPGDGQFIIFEDVRTNQKRTGYKVSIDEKTISIRDIKQVRFRAVDNIKPDPIEIVPRQHVPAHTIHIAATEQELREHGDFVDSAVVEIVKSLNSKQAVPLELKVLPVKVLSPVADSRRVAKAESDAAFAALPDNDISAVLLGWRAVVAEQKIEMLTEFDPEIRKAIEASRLTAELSERLSKAEVGLTMAGPDLIEAARNKTPLAQILQGDLRETLKNKIMQLFLSGGTHVLETQLSDPKERGSYHLSFRLYESKTGKIVWSGDADRDTSKLFSGAEIASYPYLMNTGKPTLLEFGEKFAPAIPKKPEELLGGLPLHEDGPLDLHKAEGREKLALDLSQGRNIDTKVFEHPVPGGLFTRLGFLEQASLGNADEVNFRDLFGTRAYPLPESKEVTISRREVTNFSSVPYAHQLRYILWDIARSLLPPAGRVKRQVNGEFTIDMGEGHGLQVKDRLIARRAGDAGSVDRILSTELIVTHVEEDRVTASPDQAQAGLPGAELPAPGDIVHERLKDPIRIAIAPPLLRKAPIPPVPTPPKMANGKRPPPMKPQDWVKSWNDAADRAVQTLPTMMINALNQIGVPVVEREQLNKLLQMRNIAIAADQPILVGRYAHATHLLTLDLTPDLYFALTNIKVVDTRTGEVVRTAQGYHYTAGTMKAWKP